MSITTWATEYAASEKCRGATALIKRPGPKWKGRASGSAQCLNWGARLPGPFWAECGQRDIPPYPSMRDLAVDAVAEFSGWDGRLLNTVRALVLRPGLLTHEFLEGRR